MDQITNIIEDTDFRRKVLDLLDSKLKLIEKDNLTPLGVKVNTQKLKLEI